MSKERNKRTTVTLSDNVHSKLKAAKPYNSISFSEFIEELLAEYEKNREEGPDES